MTKKSLSETDICDKFITPAVQQAGWDLHEQIFREYTLRPGRVVVRSKSSSRDPKSVLRADYVLCQAFVETARPRLIAFAPATAQKNINLEALGSLLIPLPPLAEMGRIVARVDSLRRLCADLHQRRSASQTTQAHLADALVQQAA